ncbi:MAG: glycosyltransferase family 9 protein [Verrucomicrobia bacterium]|nr:glycosyltransferase family 9 protein [Verrucomicrobiota bacterium]
MKFSLTDALARLAAEAVRRPSPRTENPPSLAASRRILVVKLDAMGDFVLLTPFLRELRRVASAARIALVTGPAGAALAAACPHVDERAVLVPDAMPRRLGDARRALRMGRFLRRSLAPGPFDLAFIPRTGADLAHARLLAFLSGAPIRVGYDHGSAPMPASAALTLALPYPVPPVHEVEANLALLSALGVVPQSTALELHCAEPDIRTVTDRLGAAGIDPSRPLLVLGVGASLPHKRWPTEQFVRLAGHFAVRGWTVVVVGDETDRERFGAGAPRVFNWAGTLTPPQTWQLLTRAALFVGNDSGPVHLAAAASCPCVVVAWDRPDHDPAGVNSCQRFRPYGTPHTLVHPRDASGRCDASLVEFDAVVAAAEAMAPRISP